MGNVGRLMPLPIMQRPSAHMIRQGAADTISGAMPTVLSQPQPSASPPPVTPNPATARTRRLPIHDRSTPPGGWIDKDGAQHNADPALPTSVVAGATGASGFVISKPSMMSVSSGAVIRPTRPKNLRARCLPRDVNVIPGQRRYQQARRRYCSQHNSPLAAMRHRLILRCPVRWSRRPWADLSRSRRYPTGRACCRAFQASLRAFPAA